MDRSVENVSINIDEVAVDIIIDDALDQFVIGSRLGDGGFVKKTDNHNTYMVFKHSESQTQYLEWKHKFLDERNLIKKYGVGITGVDMRNHVFYPNCQNQKKFHTKSFEFLNKYKNMSEDDMISQLKEMALSVWILDDGNVYKKVVKIACGNKSIEFGKKMAEKINELLDINCHYYINPTTQSKNYIYIHSKYYDKIRKMVLDHIPSSLDVVMKKFNTQIDEKSLVVELIQPKEQARLHFVGDKSNWIDLMSHEDVEMKAGEFKLVSLGVAMRIPDGYEAHIVPRSSTFKNFGVIQTNGIGIIDTSYSGTNDIWKFPALAMRDTKICKGDRICQFRLVKSQPNIDFIEVDTLDDKDRGGFGSTGIK